MFRYFTENMNNVVGQIYNALYPNMGNTISKCCSLADTVERKVTPLYLKLLDKNRKILEQDVFSGGFERVKQTILEDMKDGDGAGFGVVLANFFKTVKSPKEFFNFYDNLETHIRKTVKRFLNGYFSSRSRDFYLYEDTDKIRSQFDSSQNAVMSAFFRVFSRKNASPRLREIEKTIEQLGVHEVRIGKSEIEAERILEAVKKTKNSGDMLPQKIFVSDYIERGHNSAGICFPLKQPFVVYASAGTKKFIDEYYSIVFSQLEKDKRYLALSEMEQKIVRSYFGVERFSVDSPSQVYFHELGHINQPKNMPWLSFMDLSDQDKQTAYRLTEYLTDKDILPELFAELYAKIRISGESSLSKEEADLLERLKLGAITKNQHSNKGQKNGFLGHISDFLLNFLGKSYTS